MLRYMSRARCIVAGLLVAASACGDVGPDRGSESDSENSEVSGVGSNPGSVSFGDGPGIFKGRVGQDEWSVDFSELDGELCLQYSVAGTSSDLICHKRPEVDAFGTVFLSGYLYYASLDGSAALIAGVLPAGSLELSFDDDSGIVGPLVDTTLDAYVMVIGLDPLPRSTDFRLELDGDGSMDCRVIGQIDDLGYECAQGDGG